MLTGISRCLATGQSQKLNGDPIDALALFHQGLMVISSGSKPQGAAQVVNDTAPPRLFASSTQTKFLQTRLENLETQTRALAELRKLTESGMIDGKSSSNYARPLIENLTKYPASVDLSNLVSYPPKIEPIPVKPLFFDLAWNYIDYAGRDDHAINGIPPSNDEAKPTEGKQEKRRGWFSFGR